MGTATATVTIERPADDVWARIGDFGDPSWFPGLESWTLVGDERTTKIAGMNLEHVERLVSRDEVRRTYTYATSGYIGDTIVTLEGGQLYDLNSMVGTHSATISVTPEGRSASTVTYEVTMDDDHVHAQSTRYQAVLDRLKAEMES
jgi:hypothetical protein